MNVIFKIRIPLSTSGIYPLTRFCIELKNAQDGAKNVGILMQGQKPLLSRTCKVMHTVEYVTHEGL